MADAQQVSPQQMAQVREAQKRLADLRSAVHQYKQERAKTQALIAAGKKVPQERAMQLVANLRDSNMEQKAAQSLVDLNRVLRGREPSAMEVEFGVPGDDQLGVLPLIPIALIVAGGAWGTSSIFNYLSERERRIQSELNPGATIQSLIPSWAGTAAIVTGVAIVGGYLWFRFGRGRGKKRPARKEEPRDTGPKYDPGAVADAKAWRRATVKKNPDEDDEEPDEEPDEDDFDPDIEEEEE